MSDTDWEIVWRSAISGRMHKTVRRTELQANHVACDRKQYGHTEVRYRKVGRKRWQYV